MLVARRVVVDAQHVVALRPELVVVRREPHLLSMRLQVGVVQDARYGAVAHDDALTAHMHAEKRGRPVRHRDAHVLRWTAGLGDYSCGVGVRERARGRPERGASASFAAGSSAFRKRSRHSNTVRTWTPTSFAVSYVLTPSAIRRSACARRAMRSSVFPGRIAASTAARSLRDRASGFVGGPGRSRPSHGPESIMPSRISQAKIAGQISGGRD